MATEKLTLKIDEKGALVVSRNVDQIGKSAKSSGGALKLLKGALGALAAGAAIKQVIGLADSFTVLQNKLKIVTTGEQNLAAVTEELFEISKRTRSSFEETANSYSKFALSAKELGVSQEQVLQFTELVNKAVIVGGSAASEAAGGLRQLAQGIASGALRGDELISVLENLPFVADTIAKGLGVTRGELRDLGKEGKITAEVVLDAFESQADFLNNEYAKTVITVGQATTQLKNVFLKLIGDFDSGRGVTKLLAEGILSVSEALLGLQPGIEFVGDVFVATLDAVRPIVGAIVEQFNDWGVNAESLKETLRELGLVVVALGRTAAQIIDGVISSFNILGKVIATAVFGGLNDASRFWEIATNKWKELTRDAINEIIRGFNSVATTFGIDPIGFLLPEQGGDVREAFDWGKALGDAVAEGFITPTSDLFDQIVDSVDDAQLKRQLEALRPAGEGVGTEGGTKAPGKTERESAAAVAKAIADLTREGELLQMNTAEREKQIELEKIIAAVKKVGGEIGAEDLDRIKALQDQNAALSEQARIFEEIRGPQMAYERSLAALTVLNESGKITTEEFTAAVAELKTELVQANSDPDIIGLGESLKIPFDEATQSLVEFTRTGKFEVRAFVSDVLAQFTRLAAMKAFQGLAGGLGLPGFATGGEFMVGGSGGTDSQTVAFRATPGEKVSVQTPGQQKAPQMSVPSVAAPQMNVKIVNVMDPNQVLDVMSSSEGEDTIINVLSANSAAVRQSIS